MNYDLIFDFLKKLDENNSREWMAENKPFYQEAKSEFEALVQHLIQSISQFDKSIIGLTPKDCTFRIHRDIRFSKNKLPYKNNFGAAITPGGKKSPKATYYLHFQPGQSFLAGGIYMPQGEILKKIRQEIDYNANEFRKILNDPDFQKEFGGLTGEQLKRAPKDYSPDDPNIDLLKYKSYITMHNFDEQVTTQSGFDEYLIERFKILLPFNQFLNRSLE
ncbi:MAG TPA: TIGR02453 family protein [Cytophagales bacterium]|jgi:uncharacterized protein (TIGR02453 family)|nr:TIGR02453 family protein [Cytophagales bacterium]